MLREHAHEYFDVPPGYRSPYMLLVARSTPRQLNPGAADGCDGLKGIDMLNVPRSTIPAITHVDYSARVQTVDADQHPDFHRLLKHFYGLTGLPGRSINTSFNVRGEPIVCTPEDAYRCFMGTFMDALVLGRTMVLKEEQPDARGFDMEAYRRSSSWIEPCVNGRDHPGRAGCAGRVIGTTWYCAMGMRRPIRETARAHAAGTAGPDGRWDRHSVPVSIKRRAW